MHLVKTNKSSTAATVKSAIMIMRRCPLFQRAPPTVSGFQTLVSIALGWKCYHDGSLLIKRKHLGTFTSKIRKKSIDYSS